MGAFQVAHAVLAASSVAVALGWLYRADLWVLQTAQVYPSGFLPAVSDVFSFFGDVEIAASAFSLLLAALFWCGRRAFAGRLLVVFVTTALVELAMIALPAAAADTRGQRVAGGLRPARRRQVPLSLPERPYAPGRYPFGGVVRLSENRVVRVGILLMLCGIAAGRIYIGVH